MDGLNDYGTLESTYAVPPIIDAIQEFKVVSHTDSAEFGSVLGGVVNVTTKTGSNALHASAWEYLRNNVFDARSYFLPTTQAKPPYHQNQFGASVGGPVVIPKLYNGRTRPSFSAPIRVSGIHNRKTTTCWFRPPHNSPETKVAPPPSTIRSPRVLTRTSPAAIFAIPFPAIRFRLSLIDPRMVAYAKFMFPTAGTYIPSSNSQRGRYRLRLIQNQNEFNVRGDQNFGAKNSAWFRYSFINSRATTSGGLPGLPQADANQCS